MVRDVCAGGRNHMSHRPAKRRTLLGPMGRWMERTTAIGNKVNKLTNRKAHSLSASVIHFEGVTLTASDMVERFNCYPFSLHSDDDILQFDACECLPYHAGSLSSLVPSTTRNCHPYFRP